MLERPIALAALAMLLIADAASAQSRLPARAPTSLQTCEGARAALATKPERLSDAERQQAEALLKKCNASAIDPAFTRRLRPVIEAPMPDAGERRENWRNVLPPSAKTGSDPKDPE